VQVGLGADGLPELATYSQPEEGEARDWDDVAHHESDHPIVYVAPLSHACYFEAGAHPYIFGVDNPDDSLAPMLPGVEEFGAWADWPGRWGASRGLVGRRVRRPQPGEPGASEDEVGGPGHVARPVQGRHAAAVDPRPRPPGGDRHLSEAARHRRPPQGRGDGGRVRSIPHRSAGPRTGW
jgi:hypothetical protein